MFHVPAKRGGVNSAVDEDRCHNASWTAWLANIPSVMGIMGMVALDVCIDKSPDIGEQLSTVQSTVAQATGRRSDTAWGYTFAVMVETIGNATHCCRQRCLGTINLCR